MLFPPFIVQDLAVSWAILSDKRPKPLFPHWLAYATTGLTLTFYPALGVHCVHYGAMAWDGALEFWLGAAGFGIQVGLLVSFLIKAVGRPNEEDVVEISGSVRRYVHVFCLSLDFPFLGALLFRGEQIREESTE